MHKIYALFDFELNQKKGLSLEAFASLANRKKAVYLQYRDKVNSQKTKTENLKILRTVYNGKLIINDNISLIDYCDGLHVGQEDLYAFSKDPLKAVGLIRKTIGDKLLGLSTHNIEEIIVANSLELDYIGLGAFRDTSTKDVSMVLGKSLSKVAFYSKHKVAAIGGVRVDDKIKHVDFLVLGSNIYED